MICEPCTEAGRWNKLGAIPKAYRTHRKCTGDCPCQHKIGDEHVRLSYTKEQKKTPIGDYSDKGLS